MISKDWLFFLSLGLNINDNASYITSWGTVNTAGSIYGCLYIKVLLYSNYILVYIDIVIYINIVIYFTIYQYILIYNAIYKLSLC